MNKLMEDFPSGFTCLGFFSNQFGHQTNTRDHEIELALSTLRPGKGYKAKFPLFARADVNGTKELKLFTYLKEKLPFPSGKNANHIMSSSVGIIWAPVKRNDISWNFEKFLVDKNGVPVKRYTSQTDVMELKKDIAELIKA
eukprot:CAMPEP_0167761374 /NCGR_PEP_ID=MMETSP0110_2-20121227/12131_1 /TAXON_ID=629695 /ORGANISM="Gymnochlora sp., Strain CCMP2014" /LENGTH=140 /DNA_ID=CAMNT_0007648039 /DNA_START=160 /DNA_END=582 /DNA_ORIENTATION=+